MPAYYLSEDDVILLRSMAEQYRQGNIGNHKGRTTIYTEEAQSPDTQLVIPRETIPRRSNTSLSVGECSLYTIRESTLEEMDVGVLEVYNLTETPLSPEEVYLAVKTKQGHWVIPESISSFTYIIQFEIVSKVGLGTGTGTDTPDIPTDVQVAKVVNSAFGMTDVPDSFEGRILVYDTSGCFFNEPDEDLECRIGYAIYMKQEGLDPSNTLRPETGTGVEVTSVNLAGRWEVFSLCCAPV